MNLIMVWVYDHPLTKQEQAAYKVLVRLLKDKNEALYRTKVFSLAGYVLMHHPKTQHEIETSAYFDKDHKHPIFNAKAAKAILKALKQSGGRSGYPFINYVIFKFKDKVLGILPGFVGSVVNGVGTVATFPITLLKKLPVVGDFADLGIDLLHGVVEVGVTTAEDMAKNIGGPIGAVGAVPFVALPTAIGAVLAIGQGDPGQALNHAVKLIPFVGTSINKGMTQMEHQVEKMRDHPSIASYVPLVGDYVAQPEGDAAIEEPVPTPTGGKRFSTRKRRGGKWLKTQRRKSGTR